MPDEEKKPDGSEKDQAEKKVALSQEEIDKLIAENDELAKKNEEITKNLEVVAAERENYRRGLLKERGKLPDGEAQEEDLDAKISKLVDEKLSTSNEAKLLKEKDEITKRLIQRNNELTVALKSRAQVDVRTTGGGESHEDDSAGVPFWPEEKLKYFKKHGIDPDKVKENLLKIKGK